MFKLDSSRDVLFGTELPAATPFPLMPMTSPLSASGSVNDITSKNDGHERAASNSAASAGAAQQFAFTPLFHSMKHVCATAKQPMAFWKLDSKELLCFNEAFAMLIEADPVLLQQGLFRWTDLRVVNRDLNEVRLTDEAPNALKVIAEFSQHVLAGTSRFAQLNFSFISAAGRLKHIALTLSATHVCNEILWLAVDLDVENKHAQLLTAHHPNQSHHKQQYLQQQQQQQQRHCNDAPRVAGSQTHDMKRNGKLAAKAKEHPMPAPAISPATDRMERKLVKVLVRKKNPWDQNVVKFSLKKARKRSKQSSASCIAAIVAAADEAKEEQEIGQRGDHQGSTSQLIYGVALA